MNNRISSELKDTPEQNLVVEPLVERLVNGGWQVGQIFFGKNEWKVPKTPSEASKLWPLPVGRRCGVYIHKTRVKHIHS